MDVIQILLVLCLVGFLLWLANSYIPMQPVVRSIINFIVVMVLIIWLFQVFGLISGRPLLGNL